MMSHLKVEKTTLEGVLKLEKRKMTDGRGHFSRMFCKDELSEAGAEADICQINHTQSREKGTIRGFHFQYPPAAEQKIVNCLRGAVLDVALDLRQDSVTFGQVFATELSDENWCSLIIPSGVAHGFQALTNDVELLYLHSAPYSPGYEAGVNPLDEEIDIQWPCQITQISPKDRALPEISRVTPVRLPVGTA